MREKKQSTKPNNGKTPATELPASPRVTSPPCVSCRSAETFVYCTRGRIRYTKCRYCGHTWSFAK